MIIKTLLLFLAHDNGLPQLNNYATLIIDVTDVNDHTPNVLFTQVNGTIMNNRLINLAECSMQSKRKTQFFFYTFVLSSSSDTPLFYIYITDDDSGDNGRVTCTLNDTRLNLHYLTVNAYSLQIADVVPSFDYELEQFVVVHLQCIDAGPIPLSTSTFFHLQIDDCPDHPPEILSPRSFNQSMILLAETIELPFIVTQLFVDDRDQSQAKIFAYSFTVSPHLNLSLSSNGTLILHSIPFLLGQFLINITVADLTNLTSSISIPLIIHSLNETRNSSVERNSAQLMSFLIVFILIFLAALFIALCCLIAFLLRTNLRPPVNSSSQSTTSSNEHGDSSQKTTIEVFDERTMVLLRESLMIQCEINLSFFKNSSNNIYQQYEIEQARTTRANDQSDFDYSEKVI